MRRIYFLYFPLFFYIIINFAIKNVSSTLSSIKNVKYWNKNMNFDNIENWIGYERNCSKNIYSFPMDMEPSVISLSSRSLPNITYLVTKEIILPQFGHFVFQMNATIQFNSPSSSMEENCKGTECKFGRKLRSDWYDPNNWNGNVDSLLNLKAIPHFERVPCQYDSVQFPSKTFFHLFIPLNVWIHKFFLGKKELNYIELSELIDSGLGSIQFKKASNHLKISLKHENDCIEDNDNCICKNYDSKLIGNKICSFVRCEHKIEECKDPILPDGFCCPICGYRLKIRHNGNLRLLKVKSMLDSSMKSFGLQREGHLAISISRIAQKFAHIVFIPWLNKTKNVEKLIDEIRTYLDLENTVAETTLTKSWESGSKDELSSGNAGVGSTILIVLLILTLIFLVGLFLFWIRKKRYPSMTWNSIVSRLPQMPGFTENQRPSFSFARFSNERISNINIGASISSDVQRTERVDSEAKAIEAATSTLSSPEELGFSNLTYDIAGLTEQSPVSQSKNPNDEDHLYDLVEVGPEKSNQIEAGTKEE